MALSDENYKYLLQRINSRKALFNHLEALTSFFVLPLMETSLPFYDTRTRNAA